MLNFDKNLAKKIAFDDRIELWTTRPLASVLATQLPMTFLRLISLRLKQLSYKQTLIGLRKFFMEKNLISFDDSNIPSFISMCISCEEYIYSLLTLQLIDNII